VDVSKSEQAKTGVQSIFRQTGNLVFQRHHGLAVATEGGYPLQVAIGLVHDHDGSITVDGVSGVGKVPAAPFMGLRFDLGLNRLRGRGLVGHSG
jgi:hypothetical protein